MNALILGIFWIIYYAMHSALAASWVKSFFARQASAIYNSYRLLYTLFSFVNFVLLLWFHMITPSENIFNPPFILQMIGFLFAAGALTVIGFALANYRFQFWLDPCFRLDTRIPGNEEEGKPLITKGINGMVRHPIYFGVILLLIGVVLVLPKWKNLIFGVVTVIYIIIGALLEERKLVAIYGNAYNAYQKNVKMLIPFLI